MPDRPPQVCGCGFAVPAGVRCACKLRADRERKAHHDRQRPSARQRGYNSKWDRERKRYLAAHSCCRRCGEPATVVDHITPHRGNRALFWDRANWQPLCTTCHSRNKQALERGLSRTFADREGTGGGSLAHDEPQLEFRRK